MQTPVSIWRRLLFGTYRVAIGVIVVFLFGWWIGIRMPGKNPSGAAPLSAADIILRDELKADVQHLAGDIGERNLSRYPQLNAAADFIEKSFRQAGLQPRRDSYEVNGLGFCTISKPKSMALLPRSSSSVRTMIPFSARRAQTIMELESPPCSPSLDVSRGSRLITLCVSLRLLMKSRLTFRHHKWAASFMRDAAKRAAIASPP